MFENLAPGASKDDLVRELLPVVKGEAWKLFSKAPRALEVEELISAGNLGLATASAQWDSYCAKNGYDPAALNYFGAYALRRLRGAMLDHLRSADWVTRSCRDRAKVLYAAGDGMGRSDEELARVTGMTPAEVRQTRAAVAAKPVSLDDVDYESGPGHSGLADQSADVETAAAVNEILGAATGVLAALPAEAMAVIALAYYHQLPDGRIGAILGLAEATVADVRREAVLDVHSAMVAVASGARPRIPNRAETAARYGAMLAAIPPGWEPPRRVSDSDRSRSTEAGTVASHPGKECVRCGEWFELSRFAWWSKARERRSPYHDECDRQRQRDAYARRQARREMVAA